METIFVNIKSLLFLALELSVLIITAAGLVAGIYRNARDRAQEARRHDRLAPEAF